MLGQGLKNKDIQNEYDRWLALIGPADPYYSKFTIGLHEVMQAHFLLADFFSSAGEGIGGVGPKNMNLLQFRAGTPVRRIWWKAEVEGPDPDLR